MNESVNTAAAATSSDAGLRRRRLTLLAAAVAVAGIATGLWWGLHARYYEHTDDAYVASDLVQISSQVPGTVLAVQVDDTQQVQKGQVLVVLDPADARVAVASAEAGLASAVRQVRALFAQTDALRAQVRERQTALDAAKADLRRREQVAGEGAVSAEEVQHARDLVAQREAALSATRESFGSNQAQIAGTGIADNPQVLAAAARLRDASLALRRTTLTAPLSGTVARRNVQIGARIAAGTPLMSVVPLDQVWVDANFKEVQLARMRIGQPVTLHADLYGGDVTYHGRIAGLGAGSGSAFALLPAQNASGNWIKIVQRVPVRIRLDAAELARHPLRVGLSMTAEVDLHDTTGSLVATQVRGDSPRATVASQVQDDEIDRRIAALIAANAGGTTP